MNECTAGKTDLIIEHECTPQRHEVIMAESHYVISLSELAYTGICITKQRDTIWQMNLLQQSDI